MFVATSYGRQGRCSSGRRGLGGRPPGLQLPGHRWLREGPAFDCDLHII